MTMKKTTTTILALAGIMAAQAGGFREVPLPEVAYPVSPRVDAPAEALRAPEMYRHNPLSRVQRVAEIPEGKTLQGYIYWDDEDMPEGVMRMNLEGRMEHLFSNKYMGNKGYECSIGWVRGDRLCSMAVHQSLTVDDYQYVESDLYTGEILAQHEVPLVDPETMFPNYLPMFIVAAYNPDDDRIYAFSSNSGGNGYSYVSAPATEPEKSELIAEMEWPQVCATLCYCEKDKKLYGVNRDNNFVSIDPATGEQTVHMELGVKTRYSNAGLIYIPESDSFIWQAFLTDGTSSIWEIDVTNNRFYTLFDFSTNYSVTRFYLTDVAKDPAPISRPDLDRKVMQHKDNAVDVSYFMPETTFAGEPVTGSLTWTALLDGETYSSGTADAGGVAEVNFKDVATGMHKFEIYVEQDGKKSPNCFFSSFVGYDKPNPVDAVYFSEEGISWTPVDRSVNNGYLDLDNMVYRVKVNGEEVATTKETSYSYRIPDDKPYRAYEVSVVVDNNGVLSEETKSKDMVRAGLPWELDAYLRPTQDDFKASIQLDLDGDGVSWSYSEKREINGEIVPLFLISSPNSEMANDWLFLPPMNFDDPDAVYEVTYDAGNFNTYYDDLRFGMFLTSDTDPETVVATVQETRPFKMTTDFTTYTSRITVPKAGKYHLALYHNNEIYMTGMFVSRIHVKKIEVIKEMPMEVTDAEVTPAPGAELRANVSFRMPLKYISGNDIPADNEIGVEVKCLGEGGGIVNLTGKPGQQLSTDVTTLQGENEIVITTMEGEDVGPNVVVGVYTGYDVPGPVSSLTGYTSEDNLSLTCTWGKPKEGEKGHYIDPDAVEYVIYTYDRLEGWIEVENVGAGVYTYTMSVDPDSPLKSVRLGVAPSTVAGVSQTIPYMTDTLGKPYDMPVEEKYQNNTFNYNPVRILHPTDDYGMSDWGVLEPHRVDPNMANETGIACYGQSDTDDNGSFLMLPKFSTKGADDACVAFTFWTGAIMPEIRILAETYGTTIPVELGTVEPGEEEWKTFVFRLPDNMQNRDWVTIYLDCYFPTANHLCVMSDYTFARGLNVNSVESTPVVDGKINVADGVVTFTGFEGEAIEVSRLDGVRMGGVAEAPESWSIALDGGIYAVRSGNRNFKIIVK